MEIHILFFIAAVVAGAINALAGGGGLITAKKMSPVFRIRCNTRRFAPPRMEFVARSPARFARSASTCARTFSNQ